MTKVKSVNSTVQEGDVLLSVDGQSLRHKRPAQVFAVLEDTHPKSVVLIARGLKRKLLSVSETGKAFVIHSIWMKLLVACVVNF